MVQVILQLVLAVILGGIIGWEREIKGKAAGFQTYSLVTLGACLFTLITFELFNFFNGKIGVSFDPSRIILAVATGIGFIGAGVIIYRQSRIEGITTASGLWCSAGIGVAIGAKLYFLAILSTFLAILVLIVFGKIEKKYLAEGKKKINK